MQGNQDVYKIAMIGDTGVGKTFLLKRYVDDILPETNFPTIGIEFAKKTVELPNGGSIKTQIWDTAGQERYRSICKMHYRDADGAMVVFNLTVARSFYNVENWIQDFREVTREGTQIVIVGNKLDVVEMNPQLREVQRSEGQQLAKKFNASYFETSAVTDQNVDIAYSTLFQEVFYSRTRASGPTGNAYQYDEEGIRLAKAGNNQNGQQDASCCN